MGDDVVSTGTRMTEDGNVEILIPLQAYTKKNSQRILYRYVKGKKVPFICPSEQYEQYERDCSVFVRPLGIISPVNIKAHYYMNTKKRVDLTNLNEALHDILVANQLLCDDNCLIVVSPDGSRVFYDRENPRTEVWITAIDPTFPVLNSSLPKARGRKQRGQ